MFFYSAAVFVLTALVALAGGFYIGRAINPVRPPQQVSIVYTGAGTGEEEEEDQNPLTPPKRTPLPEFPVSSSVEIPETTFIASFHLPVLVKKDETGKWTAKWKNRRSYVANFNRLESTSVKFIGCLNMHVPEEDQEEVEELLNAMDVYPLFLSMKLYDTFHRGFCRGILWRLFHYITPALDMGFAGNWDEYWQAYQSVNMLFAKHLALLTEDEEDAVWIHNYHLMLLPTFVRKKMPHCKIGFFLHTPFPTSDLFRMLPSRVNILRAVLCADIIGFQTYDYARHFFSSLKRVLDVDFRTMPGGSLGVIYVGRPVSIRISPLGIQSEYFKESAQSTEVEQHVQTLRSMFGSRRIVMSFDEPDIVKATIHKMDVFELFLQRYPDYANDVVFVDVIGFAPKEESQIQIVEKYTAKMKQIQQTYGEQSVAMFVLGDNFTMEQLTALYRVADVGLLATSWDGLNVCPLEFTACQSAENPGALIISEFMGCSRSLSGVVIVNPWKSDGVAEAIHLCLNYSKAQLKAFHSRRSEFVTRHNFEHWANEFLKDLERAHMQSKHMEFVQVGWGSNLRLIGLQSGFSRLDEKAVVSRYRSAKTRLLLLDYDGTLSSEQHPQLAAPSPEIKAILKSLIDDPQNIIFILSGRERKVLDKWFEGFDGLGIAAEKGVYYRWPYTKDWETAVNIKKSDWKDMVVQLMQAYTERTDGTYVEPKESAVVWHYESADPEFGKMQAIELGKYLEKVLVPWQGIEVVQYENSKLLEVKPYGINKGVTAKRILREVEGLVGGEAPSFFLGIGDDRSDEEMFMAMTNITDMAESSFTVCVGIKPTNAKYYLNDTYDVLNILSALSHVSKKYMRMMRKTERTLPNHTFGTSSAPNYVSGSQYFKVR